MAQRISGRQIEAFRAVMLTGTISGAARHLNISQPSLSAVIKRMEDIVGVSLFERSPSGLTPSIEAQRIFAEVQRVVGQFEQLADSIHAIARGENALFRVGLSPSIGHKIAPRAFARLAASKPDLRFFCDNLTRDQIVDYLCFGRGECVATIVPISSHAIASTTVGNGGLVCVVPADHRLASFQSAAPEDLEGEPLISFESDTPHGALIESMFVNRGLQRHIKVCVRSTETAISFVQERIGISVIDDFGALECERRGLVVVRMRTSPSVPVYVHWCRYRPRSRLVKEFVGAMKATLAEIAPL